MIVIGNVTKAPETKSFDRSTLTTFNVAVNARDKNGEYVTFYRINAWGKLGETCAKYVGKGSKVAVTGELRASAYNNNAGEARVSLDVNADNVEFIGAKPSDGVGGGNPVSTPNNTGRQASEPMNTEDEDDLPF